MTTNAQRAKAMHDFQDAKAAYEAQRYLKGKHNERITVELREAMRTAEEALVDIEEDIWLANNP